MAVTRIKNNQITDASGSNTEVGVNAAAKLQNYSITSTKIANSLVYGSDLTVSGNLTVNGTTTTVDTINTLIKDPILTLADGQTSGTPTVDIGLLGLRGSQNSSFLGWNEANTQFAAVLSNTTSSNTTVSITQYADFKAANIIATANLSVAGNVLGTLNISGTLNAGNLATPGTVSSTGNITGGNLLTSGLMSSTGNATHGNILTGGIVSATGTITGGNLATGGTVSATGTATVGNLATGGTVSATGNITGGNISTAGNVTAAYFIGNIQGNIDAAGANTQIQFNTVGDILGANANFTYNFATNLMTVNGGNINTGNLSATGQVVATSNITGGNLLTGGIVSATGNITTATAVNTANISLSGNVISALNVTGNITGANLLTPGLASVTGNITGANILTGGLVSATGNINTAGTVNANALTGTSVTITSTGALNLAPSGNITANSKNITGVADPVNDQDAATKIYVDNVAQGLDPKASVLVATANTLANYSGGTITYNNGSSGVGANLVTTGSYTTIDGVSIATVGTRVLIKNEGNAAFNGIYTYTSSTVLTRSADFNQPAEIPSAFTFVEFGSTNADTGWVCTTNAPVTIGTTNITFTQFSGAGSYTANTSAGISLTGTVFSALVDNNTTAFDGGGNISVKPGANLTTPNIGAATGTSLSLIGNVTSANVNTGNISLSGNVISPLNVTGNITGANINTSGLVTATGNITGANILTGGLVSATGNVTSANVNTGNISLSGNVISPLNVTGNVTGGNLVTAGQISSTGNIVGNANIIVNGTGNINGYNAFFTNNVTVSGTLTSTSNIVANTSGIFYGNSVTGNGAIFGGVPGFTPLASNVVIQFAGNANSYSQVNFENTSNGTRASTDYIATADNGTDSTYYLDMGIAGSAHTDPAFFGDSTTINDAYVYVVGGNSAGPGSTGPGNLILGSTNGNIKMFVGNTAQANVVQTIANTGVYVTGVISATSNITGPNVVGTTSGKFGNIVVSGDNITDTNGRVNFNTAVADVDFAVNGLTANVFYVDAGSNSASFGNSTQYTNALVSFNSSTSIKLPSGTTASRPSNASSTTGMLRFNTTLNGLEVYDNAQWTPVGTTTFTVIADEQFNGDGSNVAFTLGSTQTTNSCLVSINGIVQIPGTAYSVAGTNPTCVLTFTEAPAAGDLIDVREITTTTTVTAISNNSGNATITGNATAAQTDVLGNLNPSGNVLYSLGSATNYWKSLYVGGNTIYLGGLQLQSAAGNVFNVTTDGSTPATIANVTVSTTGNITANNATFGNVVYLNNILNQGANGTGNIGNASNVFNTIFAKATSAQYADLAEKYVADAEYAPGVVVSFGGEKEVTKSTVDSDRAVAGVISTNPSYIMNGGLEAEHVAMVAFTGRVPTSVTGTVHKGDLMVSNGDGTARSDTDPKAGAIIGKALENFAGGTGVIEVVIGRF